MSTRYVIAFEEVTDPIKSAVTKFGGTPFWLEEPQWPLSRETGEPMRFICQIRMPPELTSSDQPTLAYVFMTDGDDYVDGTWEPEGGENTVVIQPNGGPLQVEFSALEDGPTLYRMVQNAGAQRLSPQHCEFAVLVTKAEEPEFLSEEALSSVSESDAEKYSEAMGGNKIAGAPLFLQNEEFPPGGPWKLLLQLDSTTAPFSVNFGDAGIGYAFVSADGILGRFLWQCA